MQSDNLKPVDPNDPRLGVLILSPEQKAILENCDQIIALEHRIDALEHSSDRHVNMLNAKREAQRKRHGSTRHIDQQAAIRGRAA